MSFVLVLRETVLVLEIDVLIASEYEYRQGLNTSTKRPGLSESLHSVGWSMVDRAACLATFLVILCTRLVNAVAQHAKTDWS